MALLFSYGTLQEQAVQRATFGRLLQGAPDELVGYEATLAPMPPARHAAAVGLTHNKNVTFTGRRDSRVRGTAFVVSDAELAAADRYERLADYARVEVVLASGQRAWVYTYAGPDAC